MTRTSASGSAADLAADLLGASRLLESRRDTRRASRLARLAADPASMEFTLVLTDQVGRIRDSRRAVRRLADLVLERGAPRFLGPVDSTLLRAATVVGRVAPGPVASMVRRRVRRETSGVVVPAEDPLFGAHLARRRADGFGLNVNLLGEAILGSSEAARRLDQIVGHIRRPDVDYVSVKASAVCARISSVAFEHSVARVGTALGAIFREAAAQDPPVFVNLDMEEYRDLALTLAAFRCSLSDPDLVGLDAGIVLQAYLPDSHDALEELAVWAVDRRSRGGGRTKVRIVKGANLAMERVEAELHGWIPAPYPTKVDVDASYKRLLARALDPVWGDALRVGLASHNLFDIAWGLQTAHSLGVSDRLEIEMLEGMAPGQALALRNRGIAVRLYAPVVHDDEFDSAVAYLVRRLDENSASDNYLRHLLSEDPDSLVDERDRFAAAVARRDTIPVRPRRAQDRSSDDIRIDLSRPFANQPDTDWAQAANRIWIHDHLLGWAASAVPAAISVDLAVATARGSTWRDVPSHERAASLARAATMLAARRGSLIAVMVADAAKVVAEADVEVSEAIDFAAYYARQAIDLDGRAADHAPLGTVVVAPPWNFPLAIPLGGALAALAAGNTVILKPAPETVLTALEGVRCLWDAGIPLDALQFLPCPDDGEGTRLITHAGVDAVILTGSHDTAMAFLGWRPDLRLLAETSGKNAIVVTAAADIDMAVADIVRSAFGHAGQKCSAASLAIVERSVLEDGRFVRKLADATRTLVLGPAEDPATDVSPLIGPPSGVLHRALTRLDDGEAWLVEPHEVHLSLWSPGIRTGVRPGSWFHQTECFGPVLGIMAADNLDHAIDLQNSTAFGLTGGIHTLDPGEISHWLERVDVGNAYVNRMITGAVVRRQPFGGWKQSAVGPTAKAGGPGYVPALCTWTDRPGNRIERAKPSYLEAWDRLGQRTDPSGLLSEINVLRHLPLARVVLRVEDDADPDDVELCLLAASTVGTPVEIARSDTWSGSVDHLRILGTPSEDLLRRAHASSVVVDTRRPVADGDIELRRWVHEQAVSITAHRYGRPLRRDNLGLEALSTLGG